jgi:uncharacterized membrane protein
VLKSEKRETKQRWRRRVTVVRYLVYINCVVNVSFQNLSHIVCVVNVSYQNLSYFASFAKRCSFLVLSDFSCIQLIKFIQLINL